MAQLHPQPRISVVVPAYNSAHTLGAAIESALHGADDSLEVVVVDDGSTDDTPELLRRFGDRVRGVRQPNGGLGAARNRGHTAAHGDLVAWLDADDIAEPDRFRIQAEVLDRRPDIDVLATDFSAFDDGGVIAASFAARYYGAVGAAGFDALYASREHVAVPGGRNAVLHWGRIYPRLAYGNFVHPPTVMMRRDVWHRTGPLDSRFRSATDWEFFVRASRTSVFGHLDLPLLRYRRSAGQMTSDVNTVLNVTREMEAVETILAADPSLRRDAARVDALFRHFHLALAEATAEGSRGAALRSLLRSLRFGVRPREFSTTAMRVLAPRALRPAIRALRRLARSSARA